MEFLYSWIRSDVQTAQDIDWRMEAEVAEELGFGCHSFDCQTFVEGDPEEALEAVPEGSGQTLVYRGWMLKPDDYETLEQVVGSRGYQLHTASHQHALVRAMPNYHELVADLTPPAVWTWEPDIDEAWELAKSLGDGPWIVKDHVKSAKNAWLEACFVPKGAKRARFKSVCEELLDRRGADFDTGFVIRPFAPLAQLGAHWTGFPIFDEYRLFFWHGEMILAEPYNEGLVGTVRNFDRFKDLGQRIDSPFFVADVARCESGEMILIELNDGGCAGIPPECDPMELYRPIAVREGLAPEDRDDF